ncbi:MAG: DUF3617 domain-containing protein [Candidatus Thiodiazotropha weberae]|uniref:DUF3617 domain-containing protein n=1 Tax=Candidatus Thiodiazotropha endoloripes TaxID=1818881 RepID=UPI000903DDDC|nr:DUF3617 family protein [Candidatus Thiodiazotropha endoloripes]MCG7897013.1 DUF3617 domain-containing protein [Candidatus Thiodiazotropha weberae]MCG7901686.1 DUF3617 domain-containing protein [Candidatus Thiodiazotropha weberae]MCG7913920.1 DUF3617 domain-containing protein [Candidatus Thiodiazotropha weberae]
MKLKALLLISLLSSNTLSVVAAASEVNMNPGLWQWTAVMDMPGMPMQLPPTSYTTCISQADFVPKDSELGQNCETIDLKTEGDTVSWNITCSQNGMATTSQGDITYYGDRAEGNININSQGLQMRSKTTGERLGPCTKQ